jgi:ribosomal protein S6
LENHDAEILRVDRGGKRRLAYTVQKQRYGYYDLIHFRSTPDALPPLERMYRLSERVIRYLTVRFDKEDQLTGFTRLGDDDGRDRDRDRDDDRDDRRRGGGRRPEFARERPRETDARGAVEPTVLEEAPPVAADPVDEDDAAATPQPTEGEC